MHALLNTFGVNLVSLLSNVSAWWHVVGVADHRRAPVDPAGEAPVASSWTLTGFHNETGWAFAPYVFLIGLLMAQYTYTGYDASAHVAEETKDARSRRPAGIVDQRPGVGDRRLHPALLDHRAMTDGSRRA